MGDLEVPLDLLDETAFPDPRDADHWLDELDALAAGMQVQPA